jgi:hypothetical protein
MGRDDGRIDHRFDPGLRQLAGTGNTAGRKAQQDFSSFYLVVLVAHGFFLSGNW